MAEALVSGVFERLTSINLQVAENGVRLVVGVNVEVEKIDATLRTIRAVLADAEKRQVKEHAVQLWLHNLQNVAYDIEDVLDEWSTAILRSQMEESRTSSPSTLRVSRLAPSGNSIPRLVERRNIAVKIKELNERLQVIAKEKDDFAFNVSLTRNNDVEPERPKTTCFCHGPRGGDRDKHTPGGPRDPFDEMRVAKVIIEALTGTPSSYGELNTVLEKIHESIAVKRFLLVLDDIWTEDARKWQPFKYFLNSGAGPGSRILVTTRKENVAAIMGCTKLFHLGSLSEEECWSLFSHIAFSGRNDRECGSLVDIGKKIADKCKGLPLAAKTLGGLLRFKRCREQWQRILDSLASNGLVEQRDEWCNGHARDVRVILDNEQAAIRSPLYNAKKLRCLIVDSGRHNTSSLNASLPIIFDQLTCLRMLDLSNNRFRRQTSITELPFQIGKLLYLRYLSLEGNTGLEYLPEALCDLCNLQTLNIRMCSFLKYLPAGVERLINLMYLQNSETYGCKSMGGGLIKLTLLQTLEEFVVDDCCQSRLGDLGSLAHLRGNLKIIGLGHIRSLIDAEKVGLWKKTDLRNLTLSFSSISKSRIVRRKRFAYESPVLEAYVLEALRPPPYLEYLNINHMNGPTAFPGWMVSLTMLRRVIL
ncbi:hypothetical protein V6N13_132768 [Hibiscus sabdariffa]|uniref:Uncharacterized protein n=1 Tax=Hibiscus sabdariffa TaxID=183260 RepID=A0ABR2PWE2_9ROSI